MTCWWKAFHYWNLHQRVMFIRDLSTKGNFPSEYKCYKDEGAELLVGVCMFIHDRPSGSNDTTDIYNQTTCIRMLHKIVSLLENTVNTVNTVSCVAHRRPVPPGQPDHMPTRGPVCSRLGSAPTGIQCILLDRTGVRTTNDIPQPECR